MVRAIIRGKDIIQTNAVRIKIKSSLISHHKNSLLGNRAKEKEVFDNYNKELAIRVSDRYVQFSVLIV